MGILGTDKRWGFGGFPEPPNEFSITTLEKFDGERLGPYYF